MQAVTTWVACFVLTGTKRACGIAADAMAPQSCWRRVKLRLRTSRSRRARTARLGPGLLWVHATWGVGYLVRHAGYLPWVIELLVQIGGLAYIVSSFILLIALNLAHIAILLPAFVAEASLALWLVIKGVEASGWEARRLGRFGETREKPEPVLSPSACRCSSASWPWPAASQSSPAPRGWIERTSRMRQAV